MTTIRNRNHRWIRTYFVAAGSAALMLGQACGASDSDSSGMTGSTGPDSGGTAGYGGAGGSSVDGGLDSGGSGGMPIDGSVGGAGGAPPEVAFRAQPVTYLVHASPELFDFRVCVEGANGFLTTYPYPSDAEHHLPETNYPGIAVGGVVNLDEVADLIASESSFTVRLVRAQHPSVARAQPSLPNPVTCTKLFETGSVDLLSATDYADFPALQTSELFDFDFRALIIDGCRANASFTDALCGEGYVPSQSNLQAQITGFSPVLGFEPLTTHVYPFHVSPALTALQQTNQTLELDHDGPSGRNVITSNVTSDLSTAADAEFTPPAELDGYGTEGFTLTAKQSAGSDVELLKASLADIQRATVPYDEPEAFFTGSNGFVLLFIGDASTSTESWLLPDGSWNPAYDGTGLHAVGLPFEFEYR